MTLVPLVPPPQLFFTFLPHCLCAATRSFLGTLSLETSLICLSRLRVFLGLQLPSQCLTILFDRQVSKSAFLARRDVLERIDHSPTYACLSLKPGQGALGGLSGDVPADGDGRVQVRVDECGPGAVDVLEAFPDDGGLMEEGVVGDESVERGCLGMVRRRGLRCWYGCGYGCVGIGGVRV